MKLPEYVTADEVKRVCRELGLSDWSAPREPKVSAEEAAVVLKEVNVQGMDIDLEQFRKGLEIELEHGTMFDDANITNNHPVLTGMIVVAHLKETLDYYMRIDVAELEGDLLKAILAKDLAKVTQKYRKLAAARRELNESIESDLG